MYRVSFYNSRDVFHSMYFDFSTFVDAYRKFIYLVPCLYKRDVITLINSDGKIILKIFSKTT